MYRKALFAILAMVFIASLCFFVYNQVHAAVTCSASASAGDLVARASVSPGATNIELDHSKGQKYRGNGTARAVVNGDVDEDSGVIYVIIKEGFTSIGQPPIVVTLPYLYAETKGVSEWNWGMPSSYKSAHASGNCGDASDSDRAEYHFNGYY